MGKSMSKSFDCQTTELDVQGVHVIIKHPPLPFGVAIRDCYLIQRQGQDIILCSLREEETPDARVLPAVDQELLTFLSRLAAFNAVVHTVNGHEFDVIGTAIGGWIIDNEHTGSVE
jgi:hypothetical protein